MGNSLLRTETITYGDITLTVQCPTLLTGLRKNDLAKRMVEAVALGAEYLDVYLNVVVQTQQVTGLPFALPAFSAELDVHKTAFEDFLNLPGELQVAWHEAAQRAAMPPNELKEDDLDSPKKEKPPKTA